MHSHVSRCCLLALVLGAGTTSALAEDVTPNLQINGFGTFGYTTVSDDFGGKYQSETFSPGSGVDDKGSFSFGNVLGLQLKYNVDEKIDLVGQLVAQGDENYDTRAEWAYAAYAVTDRLNLRAGRFAQPLFMYSENIRVGQAYPWAHLPTEVYFNASIATSFDGVDVLYRHPLGSWNLDLQAYTGRTSQSELAFSSDIRRQLGANVTLGNGDLSLRAGYNEGHLNYTFNFVPAPPPITDETARFSEIGLTYDDGTWFAAAEITQIRAEGYTPDSDAAFASVGRYFGKWLPYVVFSKANAVKGDECRGGFIPIITGQLVAGGMPPANAAAAAPGIADFTCRSQLENEQTSYSLGFRYDISRRSSLKLQ
ncbi:MAG: hypothetical protein K0S16_121, partial [Moraxellaceae bacterium]|nr:hypothetical protein [Moraxellaceae bacterium]